MQLVTVISGRGTLPHSERSVCMCARRARALARSRGRRAAHEQNEGYAYEDQGQSDAPIGAITRLSLSQTGRNPVGKGGREE